MKIAGYAKIAAILCLTAATPLFANPSGPQGSGVSLLNLAPAVDDAEEQCTRFPEGIEEMIDNLSEKKREAEASFWNDANRKRLQASVDREVRLQVAARNALNPTTRVESISVSNLGEWTLRKLDGGKYVLLVPCRTKIWRRASANPLAPSYSLWEAEETSFVHRRELDAAGTKHAASLKVQHYLIEEYKRELASLLRMFPDRCE